MAAYVYANGQYHCLAGNKIVKDAALLDMKATDKIIVNGQSYNLGAATTPAIPEVPDAPVLDDMVHNNGTEPSTGTKWYVTQDGAGSMDGTSWNNAAAVSQIHVILLSCASGDSVYFKEGEYTTDRIITLPSGVSLFGGFPSENPSWETRDAFAHPTKWTAAHSGAWLASTSNVAGQLVDGFTLMNYAGTTADGDNLTFKNMVLSGGSFTTAGNLENCYVTGVTLNASSVSSSKAVNSPATISNAEGTDFFYASVEVSKRAEDCNVYGTEEIPVNCKFSGTATNCKAINCTTESSIFYSTATNCEAVNCTSTNNSAYVSGSIFYSTATNCTAVNCTSTSTHSNPIENINSSIFYSTATNCTAINCTSTKTNSNITKHIYRYIFRSTATNCEAVNCTAEYIFSNKSTNCKAINCTTESSIFRSTATNCEAVNCTAESGYIFCINSSNLSITNCTAVNCRGNYIFYITSSNNTVKNCLSWNNDGTEFLSYNYITNCAGSTYNAALALTLGTDNSIARFTNTGFAPAQGVQDVGDCPSPIDDPDGYAEWLSAFGDWHPAADSFLLGAGTKDEDVTTDADGVTRPDPPAIGAFEEKAA